MGQMATINQSYGAYGEDRIMNDETTVNIAVAAAWLAEQKYSGVTSCETVRRAHVAIHLFAIVHR